MNALFRQIKVPRAVPFWNGATYRAILRTCMAGRLLRGPDLRVLTSLVGREFGVPDAVLCGSGSLALELALRAFRVGPRDEVIVPAFCCSAVIDPILAVGAHPVLADSGEELTLTAETVRGALTRKTRAIVVPHLFGNPADIDPIVDLAHRRGIRVIDDAAQAVGATIDGRPAGTLADAGILSFGSEKVLFGLGGGVVLCADTEVLERCREADLETPRFFPTLQNLGATLLWRRWRRRTLPLRMMLDRAGGQSDSPPHRYRRESLANIHAAVAASLMRTLRQNIAARRARVRAYQELLGAESGLTLVPHRPGSACLAQVARILPQGRSDDPASDVVLALGRAGFEVQGSYIPIHLLPQYSGLAGGAPRIEAIWGDLIELPCEPDVSLDFVEQIAGIVKDTIRAH